MASVEVKENGSTLLVSFQKPDTLRGITLKKTANECTASIGGKDFAGAEALLAPFGIFLAKDATLIAAKVQDGIKTVSVRCESNADYTLRYNERGALVSVEGGGYTLFFEEGDA